MPLPISQSAAAKAGSTRYNTGKTCVNGHQADRYTVSGECTECGGERSAANRKTIQAALRAARESKAGDTNAPS